MLWCLSSSNPFPATIPTSKPLYNDLDEYIVKVTSYYRP